MPYCSSRFRTVRRPTVEVKVGAVGVGGSAPLRIQSMTTSDTQDVPATVGQCIALAEAGCEIIRVTAPNLAAASCLRDIRRRFTGAGFGAIPLVADIHFLPQAAMEAVEHVEKVRVNPGNFADKKRFAVREYTDAEYAEELERLHDAFAPLVRRCRELGRALRIGTNHGSLADRILNRFGDTPLGMVESALEFVRIAEAGDFHGIILSMKASNPKVMLQAYRMLVERMDAAHRPYPLHLGVTEAGDGEDGRIKGAIGIGGLLLDGLGDTLRVSLTEDSVYEIPVARAIADKAMSLWAARDEGAAPPPPAETVAPFRYARRDSLAIDLGARCDAGADRPPRVIVRVGSADDLAPAWTRLASALPADAPAEGILVPAPTSGALERIGRALAAANAPAGFVVLELAESPDLRSLDSLCGAGGPGLVLCQRLTEASAGSIAALAGLVRRHGRFLAIDAPPASFPLLARLFPAVGPERLLFTISDPGVPAAGCGHALGAYRALAAQLLRLGCCAPIWIRNTAATAVRSDPDFIGRLLEASFLTGGLLCDGIGDLVSIETEPDPVRAALLAYNLLQGAGARLSKTEFVACPSCGRTLFDLQTTTRRIRERTGHLTGVKIAIMGCIVNGPGEMADADFGYVGGAPGRINLYVGKQCVQYNLPQAEADDRLVALIKEHGKWRDPPAG